jgi:C4-dicarboxylate-specific signal transduction histidine kinase
MTCTCARLITKDEFSIACRHTTFMQQVIENVLKGVRSRQRRGEPSRPDNVSPMVSESSSFPPGESRSVENLLAESEERLAILSSLTTVGTWSWDTGTNEVWASKYLRTILGLEEGRPLALETLFAALHQADRGIAIHAVTTMEPSSETPMELRVLGRNGEIRWVTVKVCAHRYENGVLRKVLGYVIDDGERKRAEAELAGQQQQIRHLTRVAMLGELSGALAHELQQPLTAILCNAMAAQLLAEGPGLKAEEFREILQAIIRDDKHAGEIIQHLRSLLIRRETQLHRVEMVGLIDGVMTLARSTLKKHDVRVELRIEEDIPSMLGDLVELQQVMLNLVLNACESMSANSPDDRSLEIVAAAYAREGVVRISILDCGPGVNPDRLERVFDPFFTTKEGGLGLGLAVCRSIILAHKGRLWATNRSGRGAAFHFTLPITAEKSAA